MKKLAYPLIYLTTFVCLSSLNAYAKEDQQNELNRHLQEVQNQIGILQGKKQTDSETLNLAKLYKNTGEDQKAENLCLSLLKKNSGNAGALFLLGDLNKRNYKLLTARDIFSKIQEGKREYPDSLIKLLEINISLKDKEAAEKVLLLIQKQNKPDLINLAEGIYNLSSFKLAPDLAIEDLKKTISLNPNRSAAKYYLATILLDKNQRKNSRDLFNEVISNDFYDSAAHSMLGFLEFIDGKPENGVQELKTAQAVNPMDLRARTSRGNGMTDKNYSELEKDRPDLIQTGEFISVGKQAVGLINLGKVREAGELIKQLKNKYPNNIHSYIQAGSLAITLGEPEVAIEQYKKALNISQDYGLANNGLAVATRNLIKNQEKSSKSLDLNIFDYSKLDMASLKKIFINYNDLPEKFQKIVNYSIFPLKNYLPVLAASGSTHYIIPLYERSTDYQFGTEFKNQRSFDFRLWDDIRGRGGFNSATGIEDLQGSLDLDFNTLTHEFTHQVHGYAMTQTQKDKIKELYLTAKRDNRFMDYYAGSNEFEYFAQGVEAYNSTQGKLTLKATAKNTRDLLIKTDKPLYDFIVEATGKTDLQENFAASYSQRGDNFFYKGDYTGAEKAYKDALNVIPDYYEALNNLGNLYLYYKSAGDAKKIHQQAISKYPAKALAYLNLADDEFYLNGDYIKSIELFKKATELEPGNLDAFYRLANANFQQGNIKESINYYNHVLKIDPNSASAYQGLAFNYFIAGKYDRAEEYFKKAFVIDTNSADAHAELARLYLEENSPEKAENELDLALKLDQENPQAVSVKGLIDLQKLSFDQAISSLQKACKIDPGNPLLKIRQAYFFTVKGDYSNADNLLNQILATFENNKLPETIYDKDKNKYFSYNIKSVPDQAEFYFILGLTREKEGDFISALKNYQKSIEILPYFAKPVKHIEAKKFKEKVAKNKLKDIRNIINKFNDLDKALDKL